MNDPSVHSFVAYASLNSDYNADNSAVTTNLTEVYDPLEDASDIYFNAYWNPDLRYLVIFRSVDGVNWELVIRGENVPAANHTRVLFQRRTGSGTSFQLLDAIDLSSLDPNFPH